MRSHTVMMKFSSEALPVRAYRARPGIWLTAVLVALQVAAARSIAAETATSNRLCAGVAKVDITDRKAGLVNDPLYTKALVIRSSDTTAVIIAVDAVAIGEIGFIGNDYLPNIRTRIESELGIEPTNVLVNASHCHGVVCPEVADLTVQAVREAAKKMVPVRIGVGVGFENRIMENRRLRLTNGKEVDVRRAYSLPPDEEIAGVGPIDPEIGILRLDREDGSTLAVVYNFACHPIQGVPSNGNTADYVGFASQVIEENLSDGTIALFLQGCAGDINPAFYKGVDTLRDAQPLGNLLGLSAMRALRKIETRDDPRLGVLNQTIALPRANFATRIASLEDERDRLLRSLKGTSVNLKTFVPMLMKFNSSRDFPSYYSHRYLQEVALGRDDLRKLDADNKRDMQQYINNIHTMEELTRVQTNLALLQVHQQQFLDSGRRTIEVELVGLRVGDFVLVTFPGELTVQTGLDLKKDSPHENTFIAGYTNGYIYYAPTEEQLTNMGGAQEDSDCIVGPGWQQMYKNTALELLNSL